MKTSDLTGALLDMWVAKAEGLHVEPRTYRGAFGSFEQYRVITDAGTNSVPGYSSYWKDGGQIIERECIGTSGPGPMGPAFGDMNRAWTAHIDTGLFPGIGAIGPTPLIAAMRAYVASVYGDEVLDET